MQNSRFYVTCQFFNYLSAGIYAGTLIADLSLAFTLNSIAMKVLFILMAIAMFVRLRIELFKIQDTKQQRRHALILEEWGEPVTTNHGDTIPEVMMNLRNESVEYVAFFTKDERKICESTINCPTITTVSKDDLHLILQNPGGVMVHNHPGDEPIAFSPEDLMYLANGVCNKSIVVTSSFCYAMDASNGFRVDSRVIRRMGRKFYRGHSASDASFNFCLQVAAYLGWDFEVIVPMPMPTFAIVCEETKLKK